MYGTLTRLHDTRVPCSRIISPLIHRSARDAVNIRPSLAPRTGGRGSNVPRRRGVPRYTCETRYRLFLGYWNCDREERRCSYDKVSTAFMQLD